MLFPPRPFRYRLYHSPRPVPTHRSRYLPHTSSVKAGVRVLASCRLLRPLLFYHGVNHRPRFRCLPHTRHQTALVHQEAFGCLRQRKSRTARPGRRSLRVLPCTHHPTVLVHRAALDPRHPHRSHSAHRIRRSLRAVPLSTLTRLSPRPTRSSPALDFRVSQLEAFRHKCRVGRGASLHLHGLYPSPAKFRVRVMLTAAAYLLAARRRGVASPQQAHLGLLQVLGNQSNQAVQLRCRTRSASLRVFGRRPRTSLPRQLFGLLLHIWSPPQALWRAPGLVLVHPRVSCPQSQAHGRQFNLHRYHSPRSGSHYHQKFHTQAARQCRLRCRPHSRSPHPGQASLV